jgi:hypothetical protein
VDLLSLGWEGLSLGLDYKFRPADFNFQPVDFVIKIVVEIGLELSFRFLIIDGEIRGMD